MKCHSKPHKIHSELVLQKAAIKFTEASGARKNELLKAALRQTELGQNIWHTPAVSWICVGAEHNVRYFSAQKGDSFKVMIPHFVHNVIYII